jgi:F-box protein 9
MASGENNPRGLGRGQTGARSSADGAEEEDQENDDPSSSNPSIPLFSEEDGGSKELNDDEQPNDDPIPDLAKETGRISLETINETEEQDGGIAAPTSQREAALQRFREQWRQELEGRNDRGRTPRESGTPSTRGESPEGDRVVTPSLASYNVHKDTFEKAKFLFLQGIEHEKAGMMLDAVRFYNRAIHLVPEIESLLFNIARAKNTAATIRSSEASSGQQTPASGEQERRENEELLATFSERLYSPECGQLSLCQPESPLMPGERHISDLPVEVLLQIFRWVISNEMDLRSLEQIAFTSAGFYILCRDAELWRLVCIRTWGLRACRPMDINPYQSWRHMFIDRPHAWHSGVYISKATYIRHGEASFQDQFYRPWHLVIYYRYLRFFSDGEVLMLTTPDDPTMVLPHIRYCNSRYQGILKGKFSYAGPDLISATVVLPRQNHTENPMVYPYSRRRKVQASHDPTEHVFNLELQMVSMKRRRHNRLNWISYDVTTKRWDGSETKSDFDLNEQSFPPFHFSRVRSYTAQTERPLN